MTQAERTVQAHRFACEILNQKISDQVIAERLKEMVRRGESAEDLMGMISVFYPQCKRVVTKHPMVMDLCGTGGAPVRTFNVSTISSFVLAAAGVPVAKHGNRSSRGRCGSADMLEALGADISPGTEQTTQMLDRIDFTFLFAPAYHPAMRHVVKARKMVPVHTVFNVMGPLMNPVLGPRRQLLGVHSPALLDVVPAVLDLLGVDRALVVHGQPGMDEVSPCGATQVAELRGGTVERYEITLEEIGMKPCQPRSVGELALQAAARCCTDVLRGRRNERRDMVLMNCACAFFAFGKTSSLASGLSLAEMTIDSGKAFAKMREYVIASSRGAS
ncbi:MAG: anthranilate phosphoribosyltransferase [Methanomassiliicoccales archaeon]|nr:anthranilate phosphoribosyltransferase [Methanomassiliicoccales archaeon]